MVAAGTVPKYEYVPVDDYGFVLPANQGGRTGDVFEAVNQTLPVYQNSNLRVVTSGSQLEIVPAFALIKTENFSSPLPRLTIGIL